MSFLLTAAVAVFNALEPSKELQQYLKIIFKTNVKINISNAHNEQKINIHLELYIYLDFDVPATDELAPRLKATVQKKLD